MTLLQLYHECKEHQVTDRLGENFWHLGTSASIRSGCTLAQSAQRLLVLFVFSLCSGSGVLLSTCVRGTYTL